VFLDQISSRNEAPLDSDPTNIHSRWASPAPAGVFSGRDAICMEIRADAVLQADGFADINDRSLGHFHQIASRICPARYPGCPEDVRIFHLNVNLLRLAKIGRQNQFPRRNWWINEFFFNFIRDMIY